MMDRSAELSGLLTFYDEVFAGTAWHGPTLFGALRGVTPAQAARRPRRGRHNIWEVAVHAAYWKHIVRNRLTGERDRFPLKGSNWFACPAPGRTWKQDVGLLVDEHASLRAAIVALAPAALGRRVRGKRHSAAYTIRGIVAHDVYHAGQIQLLKKMTGGRRR